MEYMKKKEFATFPTFANKPLSDLLAWADA
jgi:hypothetical protein